MKQEKWITGIICILVVFCAGCFYLCRGQKTAGQNLPLQTAMPLVGSEKLSDGGNEEPGRSETPVEYAVYICGAIKYPGVYHFKEAARVCDVVEAAGGFTKNAAKASVNQARYITDGEQIEIISRKQWKKSRKQGKNTTSSDNGAASQDNGKININMATETELMALSGVGQSKAKAIIDYRTQSGAFSSVEDIMKVPGIKEGVYNQIKDSITV